MKVRNFIQTIQEEEGLLPNQPSSDDIKMINRLKVLNLAGDKEGAKELIDKINRVRRSEGLETLSKEEILGRSAKQDVKRISKGKEANKKIEDKKNKKKEDKTSKKFLEYTKYRVRSYYLKSNNPLKYKPKEEIPENLEKGKFATKGELPLRIYGKQYKIFFEVGISYEASKRVPGDYFIYTEDDSRGNNFKVTGTTIPNAKIVKTGEEEYEMRLPQYNKKLIVSCKWNAHLREKFYTIKARKL